MFVQGVCLSANVFASIFHLRVSLPRARAHDQKEIDNRHMCMCHILNRAEIFVTALLFAHPRAREMPQGNKGAALRASAIHVRWMVDGCAPKIREPVRSVCPIGLLARKLASRFTAAVIKYQAVVRLVRSCLSRVY